MENVNLSERGQETVFFITEKCQLISCLQTSDQSHGTERQAGDRSGGSVIKKQENKPLHVRSVFGVHDNHSPGTLY